MVARSRGVDLAAQRTVGGTAVGPGLPGGRHGGLPRPRPGLPVLARRRRTRRAVPPITRAVGVGSDQGRRGVVHSPRAGGVTARRHPRPPADRRHSGVGIRADDPGEDPGRVLRTGCASAPGCSTRRHGRGVVQPGARGGRGRAVVVLRPDRRPRSAAAAHRPVHPRRWSAARGSRVLPDHRRVPALRQDRPGTGRHHPAGAGRDGSLDRHPAGAPETTCPRCRAPAGPGRDQGPPGHPGLAHRVRAHRPAAGYRCDFRWDAIATFAATRDRLYIKPWGEGAIAVPRRAAPDRVDRITAALRQYVPETSSPR